MSFLGMIQAVQGAAAAAGIAGGGVAGVATQTGGVNPATITISDIIATDQDSAYVNTTDDQNIFADYEIRNRYEGDKHVYMMGITSPGGFQGKSVAFCQLAAPTTLWMVDWTACKWNTPPLVPDPNDPADPEWILMDVITEPAQIIIGRDGVTPIYRLSGTYVYGHTNPDQANIYFPRPPFIADKFPRIVPTSVFTPNLMDSSNG